MDWECNQNETRLFTKNCANMRGHQKGRGSGVVREKHGEKQSKERDVKWGQFRTWAEARRIVIDTKRWKDTTNSPIFQVGVRN